MISMPRPEVLKAQDAAGVTGRRAEESKADPEIVNGSALVLRDARFAGSSA